MRVRVVAGRRAVTGLAALGVVAGLFAFVDVLGFRDGCGVVGAALGALSGATAGYCGLYAFEPLAKLYADAERALQQIPATRHADAAQVLAAEAVMQREQRQRGQLTADLPLASPPTGP